VKVRVLFFASLRERIGCAETVRTLDAGATAGDLVERLRGEFPELEGAGRFAIAVNSDYTDAGALLADGDEVALIPPVSGGQERSAARRRGRPETDR